MRSTDPKPDPSPGVSVAALMPTSARERGEVIEREFVAENLPARAANRRHNVGISRTFRGGFAHHQAGRLDRAEALYRNVLAKDPEHADALHLLGVLAFQRGEIGPALQLIERALPALTELPDAHLNYGNALRAAGRLKEAAGSYRRAIALQPDHGMAHNNLARVLIEKGALEAGLESAQRAVELIPDFAGAHANCAGALLGLKRFAEAETALRRVLEFKPNLANLHLDLGRALQGQSRLDEAAATYQRAIELGPDFVEAHNNLGNVLKELGRLDEAVAAYERALKIAPENAVIHNNLGNALREQHQLDDAVSSLRQALALKPDDAGALYNLGEALAERRELDEAVALLGRAAQQIGSATVDWFYARKRVCDWAGYREAEATAGEQAGTQAFKLLTISSRPEKQLACARRMAARLAVPEPLMIRPGARRRPEGRIRLGYVSANFKPHADASLIGGLFELHDRREFEIIGYSASAEDGSQIRARFSSAFDRFVDISRTSNRDAGRLVHDDRIDILIDLNGFTRDARITIFAYRPAPVQVTYLGFPATTGAKFIDYILVDPFVVPKDQQPFFSERLVHLPDCYQCNDDKRPISERTPSRAECGLPEEGFVFCCFNNAYKITPDFFDIWMRLLATLPGSVLWLLDDNPWAKANLAREASARGIAPERIVFAPRLPPPDHLARHRLADLFLDTLPYGAHTTASDALWTGLPLVTCAGQTFAGRVAGSLLRAIGLPELVTHTLDDYEALALRLARDGDMLATFRARLARNKWTHPLFDTERFARNIESAYRQMWETWKAGRPPTPFSVTPPAEAF
jgi:predicted O-linked N-acetylglucosamine transferase (SPINDLY family)